MATYPIKVVFKSPNTDFMDYTLDGLLYSGDVCRTFFWDEVVIEAPTKPLPDLAVDTKVIVWNSIVPKTKRHFSHFNESGKIECFVNGMTSWSTEKTSAWGSWELAE